MCVGRVLLEARQQPKDGRTGCAACAGGRRRLLGPTEPWSSAPAGGRLRRCESSTVLPPDRGQGAAGNVPCPIPLEDSGTGCGVPVPRAVPSWGPSEPGAEHPLGVLHHLVNPTADYLPKSCSLTTPRHRLLSPKRGQKGCCRGGSGAEGELLARHHWHELLVHLCNTTGSGGLRRGATRGGEKGWRAGQAASSTNKYMAHLNCTRCGLSCGAVLLTWKGRLSRKKEKADLAQISVAMMSS